MQDWNPLTPNIRFVGAKNFEDLLSDSTFFIALTNSFFLWAGKVIVQVFFVALPMALVLSRVGRGRVLYRTLFFAPVMLPLLLVGYLWGWMSSPEFGAIGAFVSALGLPTYAWLGDPLTALPMILLADGWHWVGFTCVIFLAGLQGISPELYDAARIDGAGMMRTFWHITFPSLRNQTVLNLVLTTIGAFQVFDLVFSATGGGPGRSTYVLALYIYDSAFFFWNMGRACAASLITFVAIFAISMVFFRVGKFSLGKK